MAALSAEEEFPLRLADWATGRQKEYLDALHASGSMRSAAKAVGVNKETLRRGLVGLKFRAAQQGFSPAHDMHHTVPDGFTVKGTSTYYDRDGEVRGQWVKTTADHERRQELLSAACEAMAADLPRLPPIQQPASVGRDLCNLFTITDAHVGMMAWRKEGGADWDLKIAEQTLLACFEHMVMSAPKAGLAVINQLGDFLHSDGLLPVTPTSGHVLDQDGRYSKMVAVAIRILRRMVDIALSRHDQVRLIIAEGNHDMASSVWLRTMFAALYEHEPRLTVDTSALPYYVFRWGRCMLGFHHGHLKKNEALPLLFAAQFPEVWGATTKRYVHTGHRHHVDEREHAGVTVVQHPTLAARDAYAARGGWISERQACAITYHLEWGQVARNVVTPEMVDAFPAATLD